MIMTSIRRIDVLGCPFDAIGFAAVVDSIRRSVTEGSQLHIATGNIDFVQKARRCPRFAETLRGADLVVADGVPIVWSASLLGTPLRGRVNDTDLVWKCAEVSAQTGCRIALVGSRPGVGDRAAARMMERYPGAIVRAILTPFPLGDRESIEVVSQTRSFGAAILLAALGAPGQEFWLKKYLECSGAAVGIGVGSAFDLISGDKPRAPRWMQNMGLEWLHRMLLEPRRLGRRYLIEDTPYLFQLARELTRRKAAASGGLPGLWQLLNVVFSGRDAGA